MLQRVVRWQVELWLFVVHKPAAQRPERFDRLPRRYVKPLLTMAVISEAILQVPFNLISVAQPNRGNHVTFLGIARLKRAEAATQVRRLTNLDPLASANQVDASR